MQYVTTLHYLFSVAASRIETDHQAGTGHCMDKNPAQVGRDEQTEVGRSVGRAHPNQTDSTSTARR